MAEIELLFLGTGTSAGVPMIGCSCDVCSSPDPKDRRDRPSVCISYDGMRVLVDTTPELRHQCLRNKVQSVDAIVFTHAHADHIFGLDDVRRFNAVKNGPLDVWADEPTHKVLASVFGYAFGLTAGSVHDFRPTLVHRRIEGRFAIGSQAWVPVPLVHGDQNVLGFRVGPLAYCTDVSHIPEASYGLLEDLDVLVLGALSIREHPKHFSLAQAVAAAKRIGAKQTYFTHIGHALSHERTNRDLPAGISLAYDGQKVTVRG